MPYKDKNSPAAIESAARGKAKYYENNKKSVLERNAKKKLAIRSYIKQYKEFRGCMDCGVKYPFYVLDLDHRDGSTKKFVPSQLSNNNSWKAMVEELEKCDVVCANCHRERTHSRGYQNVKPDTVTEGEPDATIVA